MALVRRRRSLPMMSWGALDGDGDIVRDPTFPDMPTFKEVREATEGCETSGEQWEVWKAFFVAGFPAQKMVFPPAGPSPARSASTPACSAPAPSAKGWSAAGPGPRRGCCWSIPWACWKSCSNSPWTTTRST